MNGTCWLCPVVLQITLTAGMPHRVEKILEDVFPPCEMAEETLIESWPTRSCAPFVLSDVVNTDKSIGLQD
jgi:hypothetical protein